MHPSPVAFHDFQEMGGLKALVRCLLEEEEARAAEGTSFDWEPMGVFWERVGVEVVREFPYHDGVSAPLGEFRVFRYYPKESRGVGVGRVRDDEVDFAR